MKHFFRLVIAMLVISSAHAAPGAQTLYKSVGPDGKIDYSDRPPTDGHIEKTMQFENLPSSAVPGLSSSYVEQLRRLKASQAASAPSRGVVLYAASWCGYCRSARAYLAKRGIAYQEIDIDTTRGKSEFAQTGGGGGVPLLIAADQRVQGFSAPAYDAFFAALKLPAKPASR